MSPGANPKGPLALEDPLDIDDARRAAHLLAEKRRDAEQILEQAVIDAADAEQLYRKAVAKTMVTLRADGNPSTGLEQLAKGQDHVSDLARERDLKRGMVKVAAERLQGLEGERAMLRQLMEWSARINLLEREQRAKQEDPPY